MFINRDSCLKCIAYEKGDVRDAISLIDRGGLKIAIILNKNDEMIGVICDGDIRRGLLNGFTLDSSLLEITKKNCVTASPEATKKEIRNMMKEHGISQIPIVSKQNKLIGLEVSDDILPDEENYSLSNYAILMAGGRGSRLSPLTDNCPKPLIPINGKPILEIILEQCINSGIKNFYISVHYLAEKIINHFGDGSKWNVNINYLREENPLGTAGGLKLLPDLIKEPIIVINGDVLTRANFRDILHYHFINSAEITICARDHILSSPYGVIEVEGITYKSMKEKPSFRHLVNAGIYVLNPSVIDLIKKNKYFDMPDLIELKKKREDRIIVYPIHEYWLDIGKPEALDKAIYDW